MFRKYLKHEWRSVSRKVMPLFIATLATSVVLALLPFLNRSPLEPGASLLFINFAELIFSMGLFTLISVASITVFVMTVRRFYNSFFTDEGYLTFTLPVSIDMHLLGKTVSMVIFTVLGALVSAISLFLIIGGALLAYQPDEFTMSILSEIYEMLSAILREFFEKYPALLITGGIQMIVAFLAEIQLLFFGISLGTLISKKHRVLAAIGCIIGVNTLSSILQEAITRFYTTFASSLGGFSGDDAKIAILTTVTLALIETIKTLAFYMGTRAILTKKLNLE